MNYPEIHVYWDEKPRSPRHTAIEYFLSPQGRGYAWDFMCGCWHWKNGVCGGGGKDFRCWAKGLAEGRNKASHPFGFEPTLYPDRLLDPLNIKKSSRISVCFKSDLFGEWVDPELYVNLPHGSSKTGWLSGTVLNTIEACPQHTFLFLTKNPSGYQKWGEFPDNCWLGATVNDDIALTRAFKPMTEAQCKNKWLSIEPLLSWGMSLEDTGWSLREMGINFVVIGGYSGGRKSPPPEAICEIVEACDKAGISVWLKDNLKPLIFEDRLFAEGWLNWAGEIRHDFPH